jgi:hypothetical protein
LLLLQCQGLFQFLPLANLVESQFIFQLNLPIRTPFIHFSPELGSLS